MKNRSGFSLFEVVLTVALFTLIIFVVASFRSNLDLLGNFVNQRLQSRQDIEQTLEIMATEVRSAGPSSLGAFAVESAGTSSFVFFSDIDRDGLFERVRYFLGTSTIRKGVIKPSGSPLVYATSSEIITTAASNIRSYPASSSLFQYYDANYTGTQPSMVFPINTSAIRLVQVSIYADINASSTPRAEFFTQVVGIRSLRSN